MALIVEGKLVEDRWIALGDQDPLRGGDPIIVGLARWRAERDELVGRGGGLGIRLHSDESPAQIADDLKHERFY